MKQLKKALYNGTCVQYALFKIHMINVKGCEIMSNFQLHHIFQQCCQGVVQDITQKISESEGIQRKGLILKLLTSLKQICNHPANFGDDTDLSPEKSGKVRK